MNLLDIKKKIEAMTLINQIEIYKIFNMSKVSITENNNGSFINLSNVSQNVIDDTIKYIEYIDNQEAQLKKVEKAKDTIKDNFFSESS